LNGFIYSLREMRTLTITQWESSHQSSKPRNSCKVYDVVATECQITLELLEDQLHISKRLFKSDFSWRYERQMKCVKFVPYSLMDEQEEDRVIIYEDFI
jgi:hypothetical protein